MAEHIKTAFPDDFVSNKEKQDVEFGELVSEAIASQWFGGNLSNRRLWIDLMRAYSRGEQPVQPYIDILEGTKADKESKIGVKTHKIDYKQLKVLASFKDIVINPIDESLFKPRAEAIDITAINDKKNVFKKFEKEFYLQDFNNIINKASGGPPNNNIPKDERALNIKKLEWKPRIEVAEELAIENVMKREKFENIKDKMNEDLFDLGFGIGRDYTDFSEGIKLKYVDPYNWIHSPFETDDGRDLRYCGEVIKYTIVDIEKEAGRVLTEDELNDLKSLSMGVTDLVDNADSYVEDHDGDRLVEAISFVYLTRKKRVFKKLRKDRTTKLIDRTNDDEEYSPTNPSKKVEIPYKVWFEGIYVPTAKILVKWQEVPNQVEKGINDPINPYKVYAPKIKRLSEKGYTRFDSLTQRSIPIVDDIHRDWYKFQQLKMELRPNTVVINPQALENVFLSGEKVLGQDILDMYFGRGVLLANDVNEDGDPIGKAISEQGGGVNNSALVFLSNEMARNYDRLRSLLGINEIRDGTNRPNSKTAVAVQKMLLASSNNATSHIPRASFYLSLMFAESISLRLYDVLSTPALKDRYMNIIGSSNVDLLDEIKELPMRKFGIYFDFKPDDEERVAFEQSLLDAYQKGDINVAQWNKARMIRNAKSAIKYLEFIIEENTIEAERIKNENIRVNAEAQAQTSVVTENKRQQTAGIQWKIKRQEILLDSEVADTRAVKNALIEDLLADKNHVRKMELKRLDVGAQSDKIDKENKAKSERIDQASTNTSKITDQKINKKPPIDFEDKLGEAISNNPIVFNQEEDIEKIISNNQNN